MGFRVNLGSEKGNMRSKIKEFQLDKIPYIIVVGDKEIAENKFYVRSRSDGDLGSMDIASFSEYLKPQIRQGEPRCILED